MSDPLQEDELKDIAGDVYEKAVGHLEKTLEKRKSENVVADHATVMSLVANNIFVSIYGALKESKGAHAADMWLNATLEDLQNNLKIYSGVLFDFKTMAKE